MPCEVSKERFADIVQEVLAGLPEPFASHLDELTVEIRQRASERQLFEAGLNPDSRLMGLYIGVSMMNRHVESPPGMPEKIFIFQEDHELCCDDETELAEEVRITVLHELGHHFGMDEDDLEQVGYR